MRSLIAMAVRGATLGLTQFQFEQEVAAAQEVGNAEHRLADWEEAMIGWLVRTGGLPDGLELTFGNDPLRLLGDSYHVAGQEEQARALAMGDAPGALVGTDAAGLGADRAEEPVGEDLQGARDARRMDLPSSEDEDSGSDCDMADADARA